MKAATTFRCHGSVLWTLHVYFYLNIFSLNKQSFAWPQVVFLYLWVLKAKSFNNIMCTVLKVKPTVRHVWSNSSFSNCHDNFKQYLRTKYYFRWKKRHPANGRFILSTTKTKHWMSFADMFSPLSEIPPRFMVNTDTKRSFRKGPIPRGPLEKKLYRCNWFRRKKHKLNFQYKPNCSLCIKNHRNLSYINWPPSSMTKLLSWDNDICLKVSFPIGRNCFLANIPASLQRFVTVVIVHLK